MVDDNALIALRKRYLKKGSKGNPVETPDEMFHRVAGFIAQVEDSYNGGEREKTADVFYQILARLEFCQILQPL